MDGEVAERLKAAASKAVEVIFASVSSNLTLSATLLSRHPPHLNTKSNPQTPAQILSIPR